MTWKTTATLLLLVPVLQAPLARYAARERVYPFCYWNALKSPAAKIFPAGVRNSKFVVAINHDASAAVFSQADVGVVDDWKVVLEALVTNIHADCQ